MNRAVKNLIFGNPNISAFDDPLVILIDTRNTLPGGSADNEFLIPQSADANDTYINFLVDWGDGSFSRIESKADAAIPHVYAVPGIYELAFYKPKGNSTVVLTLRYESFQNEREKLLEVKYWGKFNNTRGCFANCINLKLDNVNGEPVFNGNPNNNFVNCTSIVTINNLSNIIFNTSSGIVNLFTGSINFNQDFTLNAPNTTVLDRTLYDCHSFNGNLIVNAPNVTYVREFFRNAYAYNKPVHNIGFDWTKITNMQGFMTGKTSADYNAEYYDDLLIALDVAGQTNVTLGMGTIKYTSAGSAARANLISKGWTITDGGMV